MHESHYKFKLMPFCLTNAPTTFQATMNELFHPYLSNFVLVFFEDILIYSKTWKEHLQHLDKLLLYYKSISSMPISPNSLWKRRSRVSRAYNIQRWSKTRS